MATFLTIVNGIIRRLSTIAVSAGAADADKLIATDAAGQVDNSLIKWATPGAIGATTLNTGKFSTLSATSIKNGATIATISASVPTSPAVGDQWLEVDGTNFPLYGWWWRWNGTYWLSPDLKHDFSPSNVTSAAYYSFHCNPNFNYYFRSLNVTTYSDVVQTPTAFWLLSFFRATAANAQTTISSRSTNGNGAPTWIRSQTSILSHVNVSSTGAIVFSLSAVPTGAAGVLFATIQVVYNLARL